MNGWMNGWMDGWMDGWMNAPFLYEVASHVKNCHFGHYYYYNE